ncbi:helix-turn-helix transcriptional regulator [Aurantimonas sp. MSK8Z-1]|uniref:helix-turn-helix transcriptional regulator n=1 Tax=Mangrovibrevibacter kandeliae TaxID=2968473 RepID=UPI00211871FC|nr:helix-turn-helix transcriptional regulator [Aurantimonas sp. MSK8Z-1]MCW4116063.1 helix-turn-helix transcriptional regulator [Aurantimonas sp. MSK8Z-1]
METDRLVSVVAGDNHLGLWLKDRRARLDPSSFGFAAGRRRTPGLRREEVAQRANVSATWYTWLEQGRGGKPSADVLDRLSRALALNPVEREHLFLLAQHRPPEVRYRAADAVSPRLQRVIDGFVASPALIRTVRWDIIGWNRAATLCLADYSRMPPEERNILRIIFLRPEVKDRMVHWEQDARLAVAAFRHAVAKVGAGEETRGFVEALCAASPDFARMWRDNDVEGYGEGTKHIAHPDFGAIALDYSSFAVDGEPDLGMVVYTPASGGDADRLRAYMAMRAERQEV